MKIDMELIHQINRKMLKDFHDICERNDIIYYMDSGTLLGAVREGDIIPWDDDVDVVMTRDNYEKFKAVASRELPQEYRFCEPGELDIEVFYDFIPKIIYLPYKLVGDEEEDNYYSNYFNRLGIDIFLLDNAVENRFVRWVNQVLLTIVYGMSMHYRYQIQYNEYPVYMRPFIFIFALTGGLFSVKKIVSMYDSLSQWGKNDSKTYWIRNWPWDYTRIIFQKEWYEERVLLSLGENKFWAPNKYHEVLQTIWGDYMKKPDASQQIPMHLIGKEIVRDE